MPTESSFAQMFGGMGMDMAGMPPELAQMLAGMRGFRGGEDDDDEFDDDESEDEDEDDDEDDEDEWVTEDEWTEEGGVADAP